MTKDPERGSPFTTVIYFPPEAPPEVIEAFYERVSAIALEIPREGWDPVVYGQARDVLRVDHDCECCDPHVYLSTSCFHNDHNYCQKETGLLGNKTPGVCKFCTAPCICACHARTNREPVDG